jgi:Cu/Ag efflux protein CusF
MAGSPLSIGTNKTTVFNEDKTDFKIVTTYDVYNDKTGQTQTFNTYAEAAAYTNSNGGSAMDTAELQKTVQQSGGAVNAVYLDKKQVDLQTGKVQDEVLLDQNQANANGKDPAKVPTPPDNEFGNLDQAIAEQAKTKPELLDEVAKVDIEAKKVKANIDAMNFFVKCLGE